MSRSPGSHEFDTLSGRPFTKVVEHLKSTKLPGDWGLSDRSFDSRGELCFLVLCAYMYLTLKVLL
jgi:hypothetical protein